MLDSGQLWVGNNLDGEEEGDVYVCIRTKSLHGKWVDNPHDPCRQEMEAVPGIAQRFSVSIDLAQCKALCAQASTVATEAFLISVLQDKEGDSSSKKKKIERELTVLDSHKASFGESIMIHPRVLHESTSFALT